MASAARSPLVGADQRAGTRRLDWQLLIGALILLAFGLISLYSIGARDRAGYFQKQVLMAGIGLVPFLIFLLVNPLWWRKAAWFLYFVTLAVLVAVLFLGSSTNGAQRWIDLRFMQFQPSEMAKMFTILTLASFLSARSGAIDRVSTFALSFVQVAVPAALIVKQPHYGGAMVLVVIWLCVSIAGNVPLKFVLASILLLVGGVYVATRIPGGLHDYHLKRLLAMEQPDRQGASYQQDRALEALGAGGGVGDGFLKGRQSLPEQQNDFVFTVPGEEFGLVGSALLLAGFALFFFRVWLVMWRASEPYFRMLAAGVLGMLAFHTIVNLGMVVGFLPVVGLWLPFMSAGGTALWLCMACVGLLLRLRLHEKPILF